MDKKDKIKHRYKRGADNYDNLLSVRGPLMKLVCKIVWGFSDTAYATELLKMLPDDFLGKILDVPVGTALFTAPKYVRMKHADIVCLDYSPDMMSKAQEKFASLRIENINCMQGDVGSLQFGDGSFDTVLSMNGFHAFPDKRAAWNEIYRVLKPGGEFIGCFYIKGKKKRTDWFINNLYVPKGYFTPPFDTMESLEDRLVGDYRDVRLWNVGSIACFRCVKPL